MDTQRLLGLDSAAFRLGGCWAVPDHATAKALVGVQYDGMVVKTMNDGFEWLYRAAGTAVDASENLAMTPSAGGGAFTRLDLAFSMKLAISFANTDAQAIFTVPAGMKIMLEQLMWEVTTSFTGGSTPAIGISSSNANFNTKGDLLGGAAGDLTATLVSTGRTYKGGTLGTKFGTNGKVVLVAADTVRFDRIADVFAAGAGFVHVLGRQIQ
jgi:hypothetical protein